MVRIGDRAIGDQHPPLVIAEIGINHGGDLAVAKKMADAAKSVGCEVIKHQTHVLDDEMTDEARHIFPPNAGASIWDVMSECALTLEEEVQLKRHVESLGMIYISTPFSRAAADFLADLDVPAFKIGSGECNNVLLVEHIASFGKPVIMSTGMQTIDTLRRSVEILDESGVEYALLECTNLYPSPPETVSLRGISDLRAAFPAAVIGFSDHSIGPEMALAAIALGACIIERHFTDSRYRVGPDISCSMDPIELRRLIELSREIHTACHNEKCRTDPEEDVYRFARSSVVSDRDLTAGTVLQRSDIWARRPGTGEIPGDQFDLVLGRRLRRDLPRNTQLTWDDLDDREHQG